MENIKFKFGNALQMVNAASRNLVSNVRTVISDIQEMRSENKKNSLDDEDFFQGRFEGLDEIENDPCIECASDFGILTIVDDEEENHLSVERQNDREEIRRKLAMDSDTEDHLMEKRNSSQDSSIAVDRLKCGTNLQMCFYNEGAAKAKFNEDEDGAKPADASKAETVPQKPPLPRILKKNALFPPSLRKNVVSSAKPLNNNTTETVTKRQRPASFFNRPRSWHAAKVEEKHYPTEDLFTCHQRLQEEAREALAQAKEMARMQMEIERQKKKKSPIADIVGISFPDGHNLLSRNALLDMNVAQLQVIVNDLHSQIETLNEDLVKFLLERDDLHMEQDSMLVDIEDLTRYLGLKGNASITQPSESKLSGDCVGSNKN